VLRGAACIRTGRRFPLGLPVNLPDPPGGPRPPFERVAFRNNAELMGLVSNDDYVVMPLQGSTQWDSFIHAGTKEDGVDGVFYNGVTTDAVDEKGIAHLNGIDKVAAVGIAGRGVLLDVARAVTGRLDGALPNEFRIDLSVVLETMAHQQVEIVPGDIVCIRTGWTESYLNADAAGRRPPRDCRPRGRGAPYPGITPDVAELAQAQQWGVVTADNPAVESSPMVHVGSAHITLHVDLGLLFGELFIFGDLARDCDADSRWTFFFVAAPLLVPGGMGSPDCAIAIR
jgi:kynurenine formamidase